MNFTPYDAGGILGPRRKGLIDQLQGGTAVGVQAPPLQAETPVAAPVAPAQTYRIQPVDEAKFADPTHRTGKYDFLRVAQRYDPRAGITPAMLQELNGLGYGTFGGSGQTLSLSGVTDKGRAAGIDPHDFTGDFIQHWGKGQNPDAQWAWDWYDPNAGKTTGQRAGGGLFGGSTISPMLQGDAQSGVQQALQNIGGLSDSSRLQQLIAALSEGR